MRLINEYQLNNLDVAELLRTGLAGPSRRELFAEGAAAATLALDREQTIPRSLTFVADIVRAGGTRYASELTEPLPTAAQIDTIRPWLLAAAEVAATPQEDDLFADWLDAVAAMIALRMTNRGENLPETL